MFAEGANNLHSNRLVYKATVVFEQTEGDSFLWWTPPRWDERAWCELLHCTFLHRDTPDLPLAKDPTGLAG